MNRLRNLESKTPKKTKNPPWPKDTAGQKMMSKDSVPVVRPEETIADVTLKMKEKIPQWETINYIYVVDEKDKLIGITSIKEIFRKPPAVQISQIMKTTIVSIQPELDQEKMAHLALKNNLKAIPVVDKDNRFLGVVSSDKILSILNKEAREDIHHLAGIFLPEPPFDNVLEIPITKSFKHRLPWLLVGLVGGIFAARIMGFFETTLKENLILATFIPLIVYMSDAVGTQMEAFIIRDLAVLPDLPFKKYFLKQLMVTFLIALLCGGLLSLVTFVWQHQVYLGIVLGTSMFMAIFSAIFTGLIIPYLFNKSKMDPAIASGPFATIIQDILSVVIYFVVASWLL